MKQYETVIGLEVHVVVNCKQKVLHQWVVLPFLRQGSNIRYRSHPPRHGSFVLIRRRVTMGREVVVCLSEDFAFLACDLIGHISHLHSSGSSALSTTVKPFMLICSIFSLQAYWGGKPLISDMVLLRLSK